MRSRALFAAGAAIIAVLGLTTAGAHAADTAAPAALPGVDALDTSTFDARHDDGIVRATAAQSTAVRSLAAASGSGVRVTWDSRFGTPRSIGGNGWLTGPAAGSAVDVARGWLAANRDAFGLTSAGVASLAVLRDHVLPDNGTHVVNFTQASDGIAAVQGGRITVAVSKDGRVLRYAGNPARSTAVVGAFSLTPAQALGKVAGQLAPGVAFTPSAAGSLAGYTTFDKGPFAAGSYVKTALFPTKDGLRASFRVLFVKDLDAAWDTVVDAQSGALLYRTSVVNHESEGTVYPNFPGAPGGGAPVIKSFGPNAQSPSGYVDPTGLAGVPGPTTFGNNANTYANYSNFIAPADEGPRPVSPTSQFNYAYAKNWQRSNGAIVPPSYALDLDPAATNLFWQHNRIHDELYTYGFTETAGNFQVNNGTNGGSGGDPILGLVHAGAASGGAPTYTGRDNAYMLTLPDGIPPWSGMFLWEPINDAFEGPYSDGNFDASVIEHEYVHGLSNRYVAGGSALGSHQAGSMGEGWSDWYALNYLYNNKLQSKAVVGQYVTGNPTRGIRNWSYDADPTTFADIGYDVTGPEVHADGSIWTTMIWNLRKALVSKYGAAKGGQVAARLITDAMPLTAPDPSMLDARDGILAADVNRYNGNNFDTIWTTFAKRGAGFSATSATPDNTPAGDNTDPTPAFDHPTASRNGTLAGKVVNSSTGAGVPGARVIIGQFEARVSPVAKTSSTGGFGARMVAGSYPVLVQAPGFGKQSFSVTVTAGQTLARTFNVTPNLASRYSGATIVKASSQDIGLPAQFLIDDTAASVWSTQKGATPYNDGPHQYVVVKLAKPAKITSIQVSAFKNTTASRFEALKDFALQTSTDGVTWTTAKTGSFTYQKPRPVAPDLNYKSFALSTPVQASYVRFFVNSIQGDTKTRAQVAELQVFGQGVTGLTPLPSVPEPTFTDSGTIVTGNPAAGDPTGLQNVYGVTGTEFTNTCTFPPASQGADAWVSKLPSGFGDGLHNVTVTGGDTPAGHDIDLYFLDANCEFNGSKATSATDESTVIPGGTAYVISQLWTGANVPITLTAKQSA
ncbi:MAG: M36 family metallopeptidase [Mycobacteriales bacterium]